jgi:mobilization protein NikA
VPRSARLSRSSGRPKLPPERRLSARLVVRVLPADRDATVASAQAASLDLPTYLRHLILRRRLPVVAPAPTLAMVRELSRLGINLNQLTRLAHTGRVNARLEPLLEQILDQIRSYHRQLLGLDNDHATD